MVTPSSSIYLLNVPFDSNQKHQMWFKSTSDQTNYFKSCILYQFNELSYIRQTRTLRIEKNFDKLYDVNYCMFKNENYSNKWFYAFVENKTYINDEVTEMTLKLDVIQTWFFDIKLMPSYIKRQHVTDDTLGKNRIDENLLGGEMVQQKLDIDVTSLTNVDYIVASNYSASDTAYQGRVYSGVYSGICYFHYRSDELSQMAQDIENIETKHEGAISFITAIPKLAIKDATIDTNRNIDLKTISDETITKDLTNFTLDGYKPRNNKMYTYPFSSLYVTTHNGQSALYKLEYFANQSNVKFDLYADISGTPTIRLVPRQYKGIELNYDEGLILQGYPQCSYDVDTYKIWFQKNVGTLGINAVSSAIDIVGGLATMNVSGILSGAKGIANIMNENYKHSMTPLQAKGDIGSGSINIGMGINTFDFYIQTLNKEYAKAIDNYFTMYGYRINNVQTPNIHARKMFTYIETADLNVKSNPLGNGVPDEDIAEIKNIYDSGITFWTDAVNMYNYECDNGVIV